MSGVAFAEAFRRLTGHDPFPWQQALHERFAAGDIPPRCSLPTGLGKTNVIAVWLIALANGARVPRRLVYVVNRRTVVDQTTDEVVKLRHNLPGLGSGLGELAISTLRGQFADNRAWSADPSRPAVICGTVDMIGSRLLFAGYGVGFKARPLHAGFLGQDVLLIHDEAHLEPAFQELLTAIEAEQQRCGDLLPLRVMELSATTRGQGQPFELTAEERTPRPVPPDAPPEPIHEVWRRQTATKKIFLHVNAESTKLADAVVTLAKAHEGGDRAVAVFVRTVDDVTRIVGKLPKGRVQQLTGTLRGLERDRLARTDPIFARFLPEGNRPTDVTPTAGTVYLVCTSAGEVGVNLSADHLVSDLSTFDSMAQRFGRVNRFGLCDDTRIDIIYPDKFKEDDVLDERRQRTLALLRQLGGDGSPAALAGLDSEARQQAFAPEPLVLPTSDILFDARALTSIRGRLPGRPPVEAYLHGLRDWEPPQTHVAWRQEVEFISGELLEEHQPQDLLDDYPLKPHELLRDTTSRVFDRLKKLQAPGKTAVWLVAEDGTVQPTTLGELIENGKDELAGVTVLLPPAAGGLENGLLDSDAATADDVADEWFDEQDERRRLRVWDDAAAPAGMRRVRTIDTRPGADADDEEEPGRRTWYWFERTGDGDGEGSRANSRSVDWQVHSEDVERHAGRIVAPLPIDDCLKRAVVVAARFHDLGKRRAAWQRGIGNRDPNRPLAKAGRGLTRLEVRSPYRHEFGSLLDVEREAEFLALDEEMRELVLHLITAHHGRGRPHFTADEVIDPEADGASLATAAAEVPRRYARLQRRYGRWGLAYLESLLRAADYAASKEPSAFVEDEA